MTLDLGFPIIIPLRIIPSGRFWDRKRELEALSTWNRHGARLAVVHGRRRLGKTALPRRWLVDGSGWYVQATEGTPSAQRTALAEDLRAAIPGLADATYPSWRALLDALRRGWADQSSAAGARRVPRKALPANLRRVAVLDAETVVGRSPPGPAT